MKQKRCTNSSCRKVFRLENHACPYCGKRYSRITPNTGSYAVVLSNAGSNKPEVARVIRQTCSLPRYKAKALANHVPSLLGTRFSQYQANKLKARITVAGGTAALALVSATQRASLHP